MDDTRWSPKIYVETFHCLAVAVDVETGRLVGVAVRVPGSHDGIVQLAGEADQAVTQHEKRVKLKAEQRRAKVAA